MATRVETPDRRYWPFESNSAATGSTSRTADAELLDEAHRSGFESCVFGPGDIGATSADRAAMILVRGRNRWEVALGTNETRSATWFVGDFDCAGRALMRWLEGGDLERIRADLEGHVVRMPGD